jgi:hypothetical protein
MEMKTIRNSILCFAALVLFTPLLGAQDLAKYRGISIGAKLPIVLKQTDQRQADVRSLHQSPALVQELSWWPPMLTGSSYQADNVRQILFSFQNGELYKMSVSYDRSAVEGLTETDMVKFFSAKYGAPIMPAAETQTSPSARQESDDKVIATWEDAQFSFNLVRTSFPNGFGLLIYSKKANAEAEHAIVEALKLEEQRGPQMEADHQKKVADDLESARQKNLKSFRP